MRLPDFLLFASDATIVGLWGGAFLLLSLFALFAEWRRNRRRHVDRVGWMPWTIVFLAAGMIGVGLLTNAVKGWLVG